MIAESVSYIPKSMLALSLAGLPLYLITMFLIGKQLFYYIRKRTPKRYLAVTLTMLAMIVIHHGPPLISLLATVRVFPELHENSQAYSYLWAIYILIPALLIAAQSIVYISVFQVLRILSTKLRIPGNKLLNKGRRLAPLLILCACSCYVSARIYIDATHVNTDLVDVYIDELNPALHNYTFASIADIQFDEFTTPAKIKQYFKKLNSYDPQLLFFAGDLTTNDMRMVGDAASLVGRNRYPDGSFGVLGDHDFWSDYWTARYSIPASGVLLGENTFSSIPIRGAAINAVFLTNCFPARLDENVLDSLLAVPRVPGPSILVVHHAQEWIVDRAASAGIDLVLAGHTHGAQLAIDLFGVNLSGLLLDTPFVSGVYRRGNTIIHISNGLGMSVVPVRYNATPSFGIIRFITKEAE
jgi:uncharacterized protein